LNIVSYQIARQCTVFATLLAVAVGCDENTQNPDPIDGGGPPEIPPASTPENVVKGIEVIYNDRVRNSQQRSDAYASLLTDSSSPSEAFLFVLTPADVQNGLPPAWGLDSELAAHRAIFNALDTGDIYSLELRIVHDAAQDLTPPEAGRAGWTQVFATNVYLRLMFDLNNGLEVNGGQAKFMFPPARNGKFKIAQWDDLPRPGMTQRPVESSTWGSVKAGFTSGGAL